ncbi:hypothetical protein PTKIN_Ptkin13bG0214600 [Pterospermum kingtungense]
MAESFAFSVGQQLLSVLEKSWPILYKEICLVWAVESDLEKLKRALRTINSVLLDAEAKKTHNHELQEWLTQVKNPYFDAEDVLDEFEVEELKRQVLKRRNIGRKVSHFFSSSNPVVFASKMAHKIRSIRERFDEIAELKNKFHLAEKHDDDTYNQLLQQSESNRETDSSLDPNVIGRNEDREKIIETLMRPTHGTEKDIPVLPIVGIAGLGKTALAKLVFNDERVDKHFQMKIWVCVSEDCDEKQWRIKAIKSATGENCGDMTKEQSYKALRSCLEGRRYLLVLDDVWSHEVKEWIEQDLSMDRANGSKIIVTTRSNRVANITGTLPPYNLKAVRTLASQLCFTTAEDEWIEVRDSEIWELEQNKKGILPALKLSYDQLPSYLKRCFTYCSVFPQDYDISNIQLVSFWVALGLLKSSKQNEVSEVVGKRYLRELWARSFFQDFQESPFLIRFKMHDLLHDLALWLTKDECSVVKSSGQDLSETIRHLSIVNPNLLKDGAPNRFLDNAGHVRTVFFQHLDRSSCESLIKKCVSKCPRLRVLDLNQSSFDVLPRIIGKLKHLRYLNISDNVSIRKLPNSICKLQSLQTLFLPGCKGIEELPRGMRYMISLRTLFITTKQRILPENEIGSLSSLQFLSISECENLEHLFEGTQNLTALRTLLILLCPNLVSLPRGMKYLTSLQVLFIWGCEKLTLDMVELEFKEKQSGSLQALAIGGLPKLVALPRWLLLGSAMTLQQLIIAGCQNLTALPDWFQDVTSLQLLRIVGCPKLSSLPDGMRHLAFLSHLRIEACPALSKRCKPGIGEDWHKIAHVNKIMLDGIEVSSAEDGR